MTFTKNSATLLSEQSIKEYYYDIKNQDSIGEGVTFEILKRFVKQYNEYKLENDKMDYTDMLEQVLKKRLIPNVKVLFVDEFQDFSRIQYLIYEMWRDACEKVYICGDDFQCIYEFNGADSSFFLNTYADHKIILPKTYRLPSNHLKLSNNLIQSVKHKQLKNITSVKDYKGIINYIDVEEQGMNKIMDMIKKDMKYYNNTCNECKHEYVSKVKQTCPLCNSKHIEREKLRISFLFRAKYQAIEFIEYLNELGIIFQGRFSFWDEETINIYNGLYKIKHNLKLNNAEIRDVLLLLPSTQFLIWGTKTELKDEETIEKDKIFIDIKKQHFSLQEKDCDLDRVIYALQLDNKIKKGLLRSLEKNVPIIKTPKDIPLIVETMHNFKGEESDINFVFLNITMKVEDGILNTSDGLDNEKRLFYVAITRQKRKLVLVDNFINNRSFLEYSNIKV